MKIKSLQISNIISFAHVDDIANAPKVTFDKNLNIVIGQNGAGKSTALEIINFIFRRVLFIPYNRNRDLYIQRTTIDANQKKQILAKINDIQYYRGFRLDKNYDFESKPQLIRVVVELDDIDRANIQHLKDNRDKLSPAVGLYSAEQMFADGTTQNEYQLDIALDSANKTYTIQTNQDIGYTYLSAYNLYKEIIEIYNEENPDAQINNLAESFSLIGGYRNYNSYATHVSLGGGNTAPKQIQSIRLTEYSKSASSAETSEPSIFSLVRLRMAGECQNLIITNKNQKECEEAANQLDFIKAINEKIDIVNLKVEIKLTDVSSWNFAFSFIDTKRNKIITDINSLSAGQKAITHLVFEAYGRGDLKGGLVIIDEPEIHLHYQFQNEYLRVIDKLNAQQGCQYILVTHSESLINSETINSVIRFSLDSSGYTKINQPTITTSQKWLVKILDNKRSTHAFFGSKILLVEGDSDRYFFRSIIGEIEEKHKKGLIQDITILDINDKKKDVEWRTLFEAFGLKTFFVTDLDYAFKFYPTETATKINTLQLANQFLTNHADVITKIDAEYPNGTFILKEGDLEIYLGIQKDLSNVINFCNNIKTYLANGTDTKIQELKKIMAQVTGENETDLW
ncbi:MAG: AAA family ATPase [Candidatus Vogelbacteria bacterium]|nr:AAA family ATPase [Candidatus Vogelbacteria bacterium]